MNMEEEIIEWINHNKNRNNQGVTKNLYLFKNNFNKSKPKQAFFLPIIIATHESLLIIDHQEKIKTVIFPKITSPNTPYEKSIIGDNMISSKKIKWI